MAGAANRVDVAVVGASLAGCATAILLGRAGLRVALVDKHSGPDAYKRLCGHFIQASATPTIERLGLAAPIEAAGAVRNGMDFWTEWGLISRSPGRAHGYSIRRAKLDPIVRGVALETAGVSYLPGQRLVELRDGDASGVGLELADRARRRRSLTARLVVGADGRDSTVSRLAGARERRSANHRFSYASYYEGVELPPGSGGRAWILGHDIAFAAPNDDGVTLLAAFLDKGSLGRFRADRAGALHDFFAALPEGPSLAGAEPIDKVLGSIDYELIARDAAPSARVALVGDAALTCDPASGVGCGWALQSAAWLADAVVPALAGGGSPAPALRRYRRERRRQLASHHRVIAFDARARRLNAAQRLLFAAGAVDEQVGAAVISFTERMAPPRQAITAATLARAARLAAGRRLARPSR